MKMALLASPIYSYFIMILSLVLFGDWIGNDKMLLDEYLIILATVFTLLMLRKIYHFYIRKSTGIDTGL
jgi:hypothetical protein